MILKLFHYIINTEKRDPMSRPVISEIFSDNRKLKTKAEKIEHLRHFNHPAVFYTLWLALGGKVEWLLPPGAPKYKVRVGRPGSEPSDFLRELRRQKVWHHARTA